MEREEAIQVVRGLTETTYFDDRELEGLRTLIPELTESEDERIRNEILIYIGAKQDIDLETHNRWCTYLEKQKEQEHPDGCFTCDEYKKGYEAGRLNGLTAGYNKAKKEQKPAEWSDTDNIGWDEAFACVTRAEKSAKNEEELQNAVTAEKWLKEIKFKYYVHPVKQEWSEDDEDMLNSCISSIEEAKENRYAYKETDGDTSYDREINWLKSLRPQPKQEKSDYITPHKQFFKWIYDRLVNVHKEKPDVDYMISFKKRIEELSFDSPSWKPSEEQMKALHNFAYTKFFGDGDCEAFRSLYEQLREIM